MNKSSLIKSNYNRFDHITSKKTAKVKCIRYSKLEVASAIGIKTLTTMWITLFRIFK